MNKPQSIDGKFFFSHMEVGYTTTRGERIIPSPEWSGPANSRVLDQIESQVSPGVIDRAVSKVLQILEKNKARGMFLAFPYFAEKHREVLRNALLQNHIVGIHMHENWKALSTNMSIERLGDYIKSEKIRMDKSIGTDVSIFSYGPGIQFDNMGGKERPPYYGSLTDDEKRKLFQSVQNAGFKFIQTAKEYQAFLPPELELLTAELIGLPHSFEWHTQKEELREVIDSISDKTR
jgi:hypothetical protein